MCREWPSKLLCALAAGYKLTLWQLTTSAGVFRPSRVNAKLCEGHGYLFIIFDVDLRHQARTRSTQMTQTCHFSGTKYTHAQLMFRCRLIPLLLLLLLLPPIAPRWRCLYLHGVMRNI